MLGRTSGDRSGAGAHGALSVSSRPAAVAAGLLAFGLFSLAEAKYRRDA